MNPPVLHRPQDAFLGSTDPFRSRPETPVAGNGRHHLRMIRDQEKGHHGKPWCPPPVVLLPRPPERRFTYAARRCSARTLSLFAFTFRPITAGHAGYNPDIQQAVDPISGPSRIHRGVADLPTSGSNPKPDISMVDRAGTAPASDKHPIRVSAPSFVANNETRISRAGLDTGC